MTKQRQRGRTQRTRRCPGVLCALQSSYGVVIRLGVNALRGTLFFGRCIGVLFATMQAVSHPPAVTSHPFQLVKQPSYVACMALLLVGSPLLSQTPFRGPRSTTRS
ncbi:hypothetical protein BJ322DRAFT_1083661 [Thelephora terrestris]|uniref:Uncharacterized protein n=1 Tax=Thelephora terrestris TaxID=56493 RepID=A0A9P6L3D9_9AGAM|nr:hypothetical protein BJ322DRAFT_1083661 [Thelephora terrestris]